VFISSATVYADPDAPIIGEEAALGGSTLGGTYALTKLLAEDALGRLAALGLRRAVVRPSSLYGYGLPSGKTARRFLERAAAGEAITLQPPVDDRVDMIHAADVARAVLLILQRRAWEVFNVASGVATSVRELAESCVAVAERGSVRVESSDAPARPSRTRFALDTARARERLGWSPLYDLRAGLTLMQREQCQ
jgi:UDP-glucose 4-epimerase